MVKGVKAGSKTTEQKYRGKERREGNKRMRGRGRERKREGKVEGKAQSRRGEKGMFKDGHK